MTGSGTYQIKRCPKFDRTYGQLIRKYYRRDQSSRLAFEELLQVKIDNLRQDTCPTDSTHQPWPRSRSPGKDWNFRKLRFDIPGLQGASRRCRLIYLINESATTVHLMWIYTHQDYRKQPPDSQIYSEVQEALTGT